jgi:hypothetical protein
VSHSSRYGVTILIVLDTTGPFHCDWEGCGKTFASAASLAVHKVCIARLRRSSHLIGLLCSEHTKARKSTSVRIATSRLFLLLELYGRLIIAVFSGDLWKLRSRSFTRYDCTKADLFSPV